MIMKKLIIIGHNLLIVLIAAMIMHSCAISQWNVPEDIVGQWKADVTRITVRTEPRWMRFQFTSDSESVLVNINSDKTASGLIGQAEFKSSKIVKNGGNPEKTGVAYIIQCGSIGKIFPDDPLENKEVEIWFGPNKGAVEAGLRYTQGGAQFPMAHLKLSKVEGK